MSAPTTEKKRWWLARLLTWMAILGGSVLFWVAVALLAVAWWR